MQPLHPSQPKPPGHSPTAPDDEPLPVDLLDAPDPGLTELDKLVDETWADDEPIDDALPHAEPDPDPFAELTAVTDDEGTELEAVITQEAPLPAQTADPVVLPWRSTVFVDGEPVPAVADPSAAFTTWTRPEGQGHASVRLRVAGVVLHTDVQLASGRSHVRLGRDVLAGRFWIEIAAG